MEIDNIRYTKDEDLNILIEAINIRLNHIAAEVTVVEEKANVVPVADIVSAVERDGLEYVLRFRAVPIENARKRSIFVDRADEALKYKKQDGTIVPLT